MFPSPATYEATGWLEQVQEGNMKGFVTRSLIAASLVSATVTAAEARRRGVGLICGAVQMSHYGITDPRYRRALAWADMPQTSAQPGAVVVQTRRGRDSAGNRGGHVSRIVENIDECHAMVADARGVYKRDICRGRVAIVSPTGSSFAEPRGRHVRVATAVSADRHVVQ